SPGQRLRHASPTRGSSDLPPPHFRSARTRRRPTRSERPTVRCSTTYWPSQGSTLRRKQEATGANVFATGPRSRCFVASRRVRRRSEEHTCELQSRANLVCL